MPEDDPKWRAIDELRGRVSDHDQRIAALTYEQHLMRQQYDRLFTEVRANGKLLKSVHNDIVTAKVGLAIGRWLTSTAGRFIIIAASVAGAAAAWLKFRG